jgi:hypothetical protein
MALAIAGLAFMVLQLRKDQRKMRNYLLDSMKGSNQSENDGTENGS